MPDFSSDVFGRLVLRGVELSPPDSGFGMAYWNANVTAQVIETAGVPIACRNATSGVLDGFTFQAGSTGAITAYADAGGGEVLITSAAHGLVTGDIVSIRGSTNYNGIFAVTKVTDGSFKITDTWAGNDGASDWDAPDTLIAGADAAGKYLCLLSLGLSEQGGAGSVVLFFVYQNVAPAAPLTMTRKFSNNDVGSAGSSGFLTVAAGDRIFLAMQSDGTNTLTIKYGALSVHRL